ncbi:MAG TPA: hypothetical protein VGX96_04265 [Candidatus Elarobacter sp.]|nr:hypothetical protein [Candidatus Elarobacter sp.]
MKRTFTVFAIGLAAALSGCTSGQVGVPPGQTTVDPINSNRLEFAVGTANIAGVATGLNTVVSWRQPNGLDGTLLSTPTIAGPAGFVNNGGAAAAGNDNGTNLISGSPQPIVGTAAAPSTFGATGGAFAYGFQPNNSTTAGGVSFARYSLPFFAPAGPVTNIPNDPLATASGRSSAPTAVPFIGGPPNYQNVRDGTFPSGFQGYPLGFTDFNLTPVAGTYTLTLNVPTGFNSQGVATSGNVTSSATLTTLAPLATFATPVFTPDLTGGGTITGTVPAGVTEALFILLDRDGGCYPGPNGAPAYYGFRVNTPGPVTITVPNRMGPTFGTQTSTPTICTSAQNTPPPPPPPAVPPPPNPGDRFRVYAVGFDYPALEAGPPGNRSQTPTITGAGGQADITQSLVYSATSK